MTNRRPLIVRLPNWVGDVVISLPVLEALDTAGFDITLAGRPFCDDLLEAYKAPRVVVSRRHVEESRKIRSLGIPRAVLFMRSIGSALEMRLAGVRAVGYRAEGRSLLLHRALKPNRREHILSYYWRLARFACEIFEGDVGAFSGPPARPKLKILDKQKGRAAQALTEAKVTGPFHVWCPLASNTIHGHSKIWPGFRELGDLAQHRGITVVCCPGPGQESATSEALPNAIVIPGLGLGAMAAVMQRAGFVVANDTGPMHVAAAVGTPVLGLFGPGSRPQRTGPTGGMTLGGPDGWPSVTEVFETATSTAQA